MNGEKLRDLFVTMFQADELRKLAREYGVQERERAFDLIGFVLSLILSGGTHEGGRQYDVLRTYAESGAPRVTRGAFYSWFSAPLVLLLETLLERALALASRTEKLLPGILGTVRDWHVVDSSTIKLDDALIAQWPGTGDYAALKIHKRWSVGHGNLVAYEITPARDHDSPALVIDESWRGLGLLADLGYASFERLRQCDAFDVRYVIRLKEGWKPKLDRLVRGKLSPSVIGRLPDDVVLTEDALLLEGTSVDADVTLGTGQEAVPCRLVGVLTPKGYCFFLTNLSRHTHGAHQVGDLYRVRWEIEIDNKVDKTGARIDEITARSPVSVRILCLASLLNTTLARVLVQEEKLAIVAEKSSPDDPAARPPLHPTQVVRVMRFGHAALLATLKGNPPSLFEWNRIMGNIRNLGHDPNWRRKPSVLDKIQGLTAPPMPSRRTRTN